MAPVPVVGAALLEHFESRLPSRLSAGGRVLVGLDMGVRFALAQPALAARLALAIGAESGTDAVAESRDEELAALALVVEGVLTTTPRGITLDDLNKRHGKAHSMTSEPRGIGRADLENRFRFHPATDVTGSQHDAWRGNCFALAATAVAILPAGRETSLVITALEEALFWGNAAIARANASA